MAEHDIGFRISANTSEAEQSIQDLQESINGLQDLQSKGIGQGFLSDDDIKHFQTLSKQATQIYQDFYRNYEQIINNLNDKRNQLRQQVTQSADQTEIDDLKHRIDNIDVQRLSYSTQRTMADNMNMQRSTSVHRTQPYINGTYSEQSPAYGGNGNGGLPPNGGQTGNTGNGGNNGGRNIFLGRRLGSFVVSMFGANQMRAGYSQVRDQEAEMAQVGTRVGGFGSRFDHGRVTAGRVGYPNGYTSGQTISLANLYSSTAGASSPTDLWNRVGAIQSQSRQLGIQPETVAQSEGQIRRLGAFGDVAEQQQFANMIAGAVKQDNMQGRQGEMINATTGLVQQAASGQTRFTTGQVQNILGLQAVVGQNNPALRGAGGAQMLGQINSSIQQGGTNMNLALGLGGRYQGVQGLLQVQRREAQGISNPQNLRDVFRFAERQSNNPDVQEEMVMGELGITAPQADAIFRNRRVRQQIESGKMSSKEIKNLIRQGSQENQQNQQNYNESNTGQRSRNEAGWSEAQQSSAGPMDFLGRMFGSLFNPGTAIMGGLLINMVSAASGGSLLGGLRRGAGSLFNRVFRGSRPTGGGPSGGSGRTAETAGRRYGRGIWRDAGQSAREDLQRAGRGVGDLTRRGAEAFSRTRFGQYAGNLARRAGRLTINSETGRTVGDVFSQAGRYGTDLMRNFRQYMNPRNLMDQAGRDFKGVGDWFSRAMGRVGGARGIGRGLTEGTRGFGDATGTLGRLGKFLGPAARFLGPIGDFAMFRDAGKMAGGAWDWMFGHKAGQEKSYIGLNPFHRPGTGEYYEKGRQGALSRFGNWISGNGNKSSSRNNSFLNAFSGRQLQGKNDIHLTAAQRRALEHGQNIPMGSIHENIRGKNQPWWDVFGLTQHVPSSAKNASIGGVSKTDLNERERNLEERRTRNLDRREQLDNREEQSLQDKDNKDHSRASKGVSLPNGGMANLSSGSGGGMNWLGQMFRGIGGFFSNVFKGVTGAIGSVWDAAKGSITGSHSGKGAKSWSSEIKKVASKMGYNLSSSDVSLIEKRINQESGGNEKVTQKVWDINMAEGHPAQGLLQYIPSTFSKYAVPGHTNIKNGIDQLYALFNDPNWRKDISRSGGWSPTGTPKYAEGTEYAMAGQALISENNEPELVTDPYGRTVISTHQTSFSDFMAGSTVTPLSRTNSVSGASWNQNIMSAIAQLARVSASGAVATGNRTINIKISGSINGMNKENQDKVAQSIAGYFAGQPLAFDIARK